MNSHPWLELRVELPVGPLFCVINGSTRGRHWSSAAARADLRRTAVAAGVRRRFAPHQLRHAHAVELAREGVPLIVIQRQLGHSNLGITSIYLQPHVAQRSSELNGPMATGELRLRMESSTERERASDGRAARFRA